MATFLIYILATLSVVMIITILGLILAQIFINRANKAQVYTDTLSQQLQGIVVDIDELPEFQQDAGIAVISNDVIEGSSRRHHHHHLPKKTVSVIDQDAPIVSLHTKQNYALKHPMISAKTDSDINVSNTSIINPLTDKITLDY